MTAADGRAHTTDGDRERAAELLPDSVPAYYRGPAERAIADAFAAERRRAAEDGQRLRERVEALVALVSDDTLRRAADLLDEEFEVANALIDLTHRVRSAALRDDAGDGR